MTFYIFSNVLNKGEKKFVYKDILNKYGRHFLLL
jgi:hypothetical protein